MDLDIFRIVGLAICFGLAYLLRLELNPKPKSKTALSPADEQRLS